MQLTDSLTSAHNKKRFCCGKQMLDNYLHFQVSQDVKRKLSACFVFEEKSDGVIQGYYTLSNSSIPLERIPAIFKKHLPESFISIPATLLGRLAVDTNFQNKGIGKILLIDALKRCFLLSKSIGSIAVIVDPMDQEAESFFGKYGFIKLPDSGKMFIPMKTISYLF